MAQQNFPRPDINFNGAADDILHRRQFLLSSVCLNRFSAWQTARVGKDFFLEAHPDLEVTQAETPQMQLTLLGFMIDPDQPTSGNAEILKRLLSESKTSDSLTRATERLSGRWVLIASSRTGACMFNDPAGLRSVFFTTDPDKPFLCASQPGLIADLLGCTYSEKARDDFLESAYFQSTKEYWWPSGVSLYEGISHLIPNHLLDLKTRRPQRFWPRHPLQSMPLEEGANRSAALLKNLIKGAAARYDMALPLTAGFDSRTLLAATREVKDRVYYYTLKYWDLSDGSPDIRIPERLLSRCGLTHNVIDCSSEMENSFRNLYMASVDCAHEAWGHIAYGLKIGYPADHICVKGNASEIARCFFYPDGQHPRKLTGQMLAQLSGMNGNRFATYYFDQWIGNARPVAEQININLLDLFYWEHRMGSWQAMSQLEWDLIQETYTPFNCRALLAILLSVDIKYRKAPHYRLYERIIDTLWPELLGEPINPRPLKRSRHLLKLLLKKSGVKKPLTSLLHRT